jgi:hypothetical protein
MHNNLDLIIGRSNVLDQRLSVCYIQQLAGTGRILNFQRPNEDRAYKFSRNCLVEHGSLRWSSLDHQLSLVWLLPQKIVQFALQLAFLLSSIVALTLEFSAYSARIENCNGRLG